MTQARIGKKFPPGFSLEVEFAIEHGVTAIVGPAGAGKTLILEAIAGFIKPDSGRILLEDELLFDAAAGVNAPPRARFCGYVSQRDTLFPHMSVRQNFAFTARRSPRLERTRRVTEMLERFELTTSAARRPRDLAPGERLRGAVGRALLSSPKLLLLDDRGFDEPLIQTLREVFPGPIVLATRGLDLCCAAAGLMMLLDRGRIVQRGVPADVVNNPESVDAARVLGIPNIFECTIAALDPGRNSSRLEFEGFALAGPYIPGHFRGDRVSVAIRAEELRVHSGEVQAQPNSVSAILMRVSRRERFTRLEFAGGIFADISHTQFERLKDSKSWQLEFPPEALRVL